MLQWAIMKMLKTKNRNSLQWNRKWEHEPNRNLEMKNTVANNSQTLWISSTAERRGQGKNQWTYDQSIRKYLFWKTGKIDGAKKEKEQSLKDLM